MMKGKVLVVDPLAELGHLNTSVYFIKELQRDCKLLDVGVSRRYASSLGLFPESFNLTFLIDPPRRGRILNFLVNLINLFKIFLLVLFRYRGSHVIFLSYENYSMFFFVKILSWLCNLHLFAHNNIDIAYRKGFISKAIFNYIACTSNNVVYMEYISNFLKSCGASTCVVRHPLIKFNTPESFENPSILILGVNTPDDIGTLISCAINNKSFNFICRSSLNSSYCPDNLRIDKFIEDFESVVSAVDSVVLVCDYDYRVSGLAFNAISHNKPIFLTKSRFSFGLKLEYPDVSIVIDHFEKLLSSAIVSYDSPLTQHTLTNPVTPLSIYSVISNVEAI